MISASWDAAVRACGRRAQPMEMLANDQHLEDFEGFQSLKVVVPPQNRLVCLTDNESLAAEKFRFLGISLQNLRRERPLKKVLITSTIPQEGKSTVSANLACTLARENTTEDVAARGRCKATISIAAVGLGRVSGICECLQGEHSLLTSIYHLGSGLLVFTSG